MSISSGFEEHPSDGHGRRGGAMTTTVGDDFPKQQARVRLIQQRARDIGSAGRFLVAMCEQALREAEEATDERDVARILRAYVALKEFQE